MAPPIRATGVMVKREPVHCWNQPCAVTSPRCERKSCCLEAAQPRCHWRHSSEKQHLKGRKMSMTLLLSLSPPLLAPNFKGTVILFLSHSKHSSWFHHTGPDLKYKLCKCVWHCCLSSVSVTPPSLCLLRVMWSIYWNGKDGHQSE